MTIRNDITIDWSVSPRIVTVADPSTELTVQDLYDTLRSKATSVEAMDDAEIVDGSGKEDLGGGILVGLTLKLFNAKIKFENRASPTICTVGGGNLVAVDENGNTMPSIEPSNNVTVIISQSSSATLIGVSGLTSEESTELFAIRGHDGDDLKVLSDQLDYVALQSTLLTLYELHGLDPTKPLIIKKTSRKVGDIDQSISVADDTVTVTRQ